MAEQSTISILWVSLAHLFNAAGPLPQLSRASSIATSNSTCSGTSSSTCSLSTESLSTGSSLDAESDSTDEDDILEQTSTSQSTETDLSMWLVKQQAAGERRPSTRSTEKATNGLRARLTWLIKKVAPGKEECVGCNKTINPGKLIITPCNHRYCQQCIRKMARIALKNTDRFPVRCCSQAIPAREVASTLLSDERDTYISRTEERAVPPAERWYCPQTKCGQWIRPRHLKSGSRAPKCPHCKTSICPRCRDIAHEDRHCEIDPKLAEVLKVGRRLRWQRCYNCHAMVEKTSGCTHMKCICLAEFCYSCSRRWPCHCGGTTEVVEDATRLDADPEFDTTTVVAAMEQAEREVAEDTVTQQEIIRDRECMLRIEELEQQTIRLQERVRRCVDGVYRALEGRSNDPE